MWSGRIILVQLLRNMIRCLEICYLIAPGCMQRIDEVGREEAAMTLKRQARALRTSMSCSIRIVSKGNSTTYNENPIFEYEDFYENRITVLIYRTKLLMR